MKKLLLVLGASVLVLSACHKATEDSVTNPSTPRDQQTKETTNYFHYLADSYQKALSHEKESKDAAVQSPMAATVVAMEELQLSNPTDQALIMKNYSDFQKLIQYNTEKWEEEFASWASSMGQSYHRLEHTNFEETENTDLAQRFKEFLSKTSVTTESKPDTDNSSLIDKIKIAMESYSDSKGEVFKSTNLATYGKYYGLAVPDQIMQFGQVDGVNYTFKWYGYIAGSGSGRFEILACYVNEAGTEVILFGYKDGNPALLHTEGQPEIEKNESGAIINAQVYFVDFHQPILEQVFK